MKSLAANVSPIDLSERRGAVRWHVELPVRMAAAGEGASTVRNLSETGMALETDADLPEGEILQVELPGALTVKARVVWRKGRFCGCEFLEPIASATVSATILQAPLDQPGHGKSGPRFEEFPVGIYPSVDELAEWKARFEQSHGARGYRLVAYRQTRAGLMIAIASPG